MTFNLIGVIFLVQVNFLMMMDEIKMQKWLRLRGGGVRLY